MISSNHQVQSMDKAASQGSPSRLASQDADHSIEGTAARHQLELENLSLATQPFRTMKLFTLAIIQYIKQSVYYLLVHGGWPVLLSTLSVLLGILLLTIDGPHEKHAMELRRYLQFGLWWVALGVASSIGLGSGLHTFVLYLGPHIALFTIKATQCGRVDLKVAPYDTIQLKSSPSWLGKDCSEFGPPIFSILHGLRVPLTSILPQVQLEAILWGLGTAIGELPPYFVSRAAQLSGSKLDAVEELNASSVEGNGIIASGFNKIEHWFLTHAQYLNFFTILVLASIPNPFFDLAGILCGQFGVPFWEFFLATLIGKAVIKTHIQTMFIILVCNNQLLDWIENELICALSFIPGLSAIMPNLISNLHTARAKYMEASPSPVDSNTNIKEKRFDVSVSSVWNSIVWIMIMSFIGKIVTETARKYLKMQHELELVDLKNKLVS